LAWLAWRVGGDYFFTVALLLALGLLANLIIVGAAQRSGASSSKRLVAGLLALATIFALFLPRTVAEPGAQPAGILASQPFSETALASYRATGKPVFLYFTADWCLTCKVNEAAAIERQETRAAFEKAGVIVLRGDWTRRDPAITRYLTAQGAAGVPLYMWYPAKGEPQQLPQVLTTGTLADLVK
jgi:thiol:disulfide interchange protein